jgi:hypothetical protein
VAAVSKVQASTTKTKDETTEQKKTTGMQNLKIQKIQNFNLTLAHTQTN